MEEIKVLYNKVKKTESRIRATLKYGSKVYQLSAKDDRDLWRQVEGRLHLLGFGPIPRELKFAPAIIAVSNPTVVKILSDEDGSIVNAVYTEKEVPVTCKCGFSGSQDQFDGHDCKYGFNIAPLNNIDDIKALSRKTLQKRCSFLGLGIDGTHTELVDRLAKASPTPEEITPKKIKIDIPVEVEEKQKEEEPVQQEEEPEEAPIVDDSGLHCPECNSDDVCYITVEDGVSLCRECGWTPEGPDPADDDGEDELKKNIEMLIKKRLEAKDSENTELVEVLEEELTTLGVDFSQTDPSEPEEGEEEVSLEDAIEDDSDPEPKLSLEDLKDMGYKEMQRNCTLLGLKASGKKNELKKRLTDHIKGA